MTHVGPDTAARQPELPAPAAKEGERSVLRRALSILDCFTESRPEQTIAAISLTTGLPPPTVHRLLAVLVDWGGVERSGRGRYTLGMRMWRLGSSVPQARTLRDVAMPFLEDLYEATHQVVHLAVLDSLETLYVEKISSRRSVQVTSQVGRRLPLHAAGPGKVILAYSSPDLFDQVVTAGLRRMTAHTITDEQELRRALADIRRNGFAVSREEMSSGTASIAGPIFGQDGQIVASVAVVMSPEKLQVSTLAPVVRAVCRAISRTLAGQPMR